MSERVMRGTRLGSLSYETEGGADAAPRVATRYRCADGHDTVVPFAEEADTPATWECGTCRNTALLADGSVISTAVAKKVRTHWDMLLERRTVADLEDVLAERLAVLRGQGGASAFPTQRKSA